jgi:hypothetical protein
MPSKNKTKQNNRPLSGHTFRGCREAVVVGGSGAPGTTPLNIVSNASGAASGSFALSSIGLTSVVISGPTAFTNGVQGNVSKAALRGLYYRANEFQWYRVTRAKLIFVGSVGSTMTGSLTLAAYTDPMDVNNNTTLATLSSSASTRAFDLAASSSKELSVSIPVDSSWKKIASDICVSSDTAPFFGTNAGFIAVNSVSDLCFGAISWYAQGSVATTNLGTLFIDYDVEFKGPIDPSVNR